MRHQKGYLMFASGKFYAQYYALQDGVKKRKTVVLDFDTKGRSWDSMPKRIPSELSEAFDRLMIQVNANCAAPATTFMSVGRFFDERYLIKDGKKFTGLAADKKYSTLSGYYNLFNCPSNPKQAIRKIVVAGKPLEEHLLRDVNHSVVTEFKKAVLLRDLSRATLRNIKWLLVTIWRVAADESFLPEGFANPWEKWTLEKSGTKTTETHAYSLAEIAAIEKKIAHDVLAWCVFRVAAYTGLRRSEIAGLRWEDFNPETSSLSVQRAVVNNVVDVPKTMASQAAVSVLPEVVAALDKWREFAKRHSLPCQDEDYIFSTRSGQPVSLNNIQNRSLVPALDRCEVCEEGKHRDRPDHPYARATELEGVPSWYGWHALRRSVATRLHEAGVPDLIIQRVLRHENVKTTQAAYIKTSDNLAAEAMKKLSLPVPAQPYLIKNRPATGM